MGSTTATISRTGVLHGLRLAMPLLPGVLAAGTIYGGVSRTAAVAGLEAALKSSMVAAGAAQFAVLELWTRPIPLLSVVAVTLLVNLRFVLMGAALPPWFAELPPGRRALAGFFLTDESWALSAREYRHGGADAGVLVGSGATVYGTWFIGTVFGYAAAAGIPLSAMPWVSFLVPAVLLAVLAGFWSGVRSSLAPWLVAGAMAVVSAHLIPGNWYVLLGGAAGMIVGALSDGR